MGYQRHCGTLQVGLRPLRTSGVRLERDDVRVSTGVPVVHNYGHGGSGITLHWGCAQEAVSLVLEELQVLESKASDGRNTDKPIADASATQA
jgi:glycine/D-amino acid oxidase-like deaminating enzyme